MTSTNTGTPCSRLLPPWWDELARARRLRIIGFDRPGYGNWPARPGRTIADVVLSAELVADTLDLDRFAVWGVSGGTPFALGCAALLGDRVTAVAVVGGVAPDDGTAECEENRDPGLLAAQRAGDRDAVMAGRLDQADALRQFDVPTWLTAWAEVFSPADRRSLDPETAGYLLGAIQEGLRPGTDGWVDDNLAQVLPWGFEFTAIDQPVAIWHGDDDRMAPLRHAHWLAHAIPHAELHIEKDEGHPSLIFRRIDATMDWLAAHAA
jgi:pimeloyl-ACP methyl ester carboxylesterase